MTSLVGILRTMAKSRPRPRKGVCPRCDGQRFIYLVCHDPQCGDGTWDHYCKLGIRRRCQACRGTGRNAKVR